MSSNLEAIRVAFDHQVFVQPYGGISRYFVRLVQGLLSLGEEANIVAPLHRNRYLHQLPAHRVYGFRFNRRPPKSKMLIAAVNRQIGSLRLKSYHPDLLHETYYTEKPLKGSFKGRVITVYDMIHEKFPSEFRAEDPTSRIKRIAISRADHIICISHNTKKDLCELFDVPEDRVSVTHLGIEKFEISESSTSPDAGTRPYLLYVGHRGGYKNFIAMIKAVASRAVLQNSFDIVAFGGRPFNSNEQSTINTLGFRKGAVRQIGGDDYVLGTLYSGATAFVYPSLYEGFGLPPLEAMAHACPVVTSNTSSLPEIVGPAGEYFDPTDLDSQAGAICKAVFDTERRKELILEGHQRLNQFSWFRCATETREIYRAVLRSQGIQ